MEYRDGFYRTRQASIGEILSIKHGWESRAVLWTSFKVPRLLVTMRNKVDSFAINAKPFDRGDLQWLRQLVHDEDKPA